MRVTSSGSDITRVITNVLSRQNPQLMDHGSRVGYLTAKMLEEAGAEERMVSVAYILGVLHDIGVYKAEEAEEIIRFETDSVPFHCIYGYQLVKASEALDEFVDTILYHHMPWKQLQHIDTPNRKLANLIFLADRVDIYIQNNKKPIPVELLERGGLYAPEHLELFKTCEQKYEVQKRLMDGSYINDKERYIYRINIDQEKMKKTVRMAAMFIDFRSQATVTHTITMVGAALALSRLAELPPEEMDNVYVGAYIHDLGKVAVPVEILEKPGKLTRDEMEVMKTHVVLTGQIIHGFVNEKIYRIATRHHEKLNGKGYPLGLTEKEMSLEEEIVAVADIFSALSGKRSYKEEFPRERIVGILSEMAEQGEISSYVVSLLIDNYDTVVAQVREDCEAIIASYKEIWQNYFLMKKQFS